MESDPERVLITMTKAELADFGRAIAEDIIVRLDAAKRLHNDDPLIATGTLTVIYPATRRSSTVRGSILKRASSRCSLRLRKIWALSGPRVPK